MFEFHLTVFRASEYNHSMFEVETRTIDSKCRNERRTPGKPGQSNFIRSRLHS